MTLDSARCSTLPRAHIVVNETFDIFTRDVPPANICFDRGGRGPGSRSSAHRCYPVA